MGVVLTALVSAATILLTPDAALAALVNDRIERVVDGDTVILRELGRARLIGINTPETVIHCLLCAHRRACGWDVRRAPHETSGALTAAHL